MNLWRHPRHGTWYLRIERSEKHPHGRLVSLRTRDETEARDLFRTIKRKRLEEKLVSLSGESRLTISRLSDLYTRDPDRVALSGDTLRMDRLALRMLSEAIGDKPLRSIAEADLKRFKSVLLSPPRSLSPASVNSYRRHILAAFHWAVENGHLKRIPRFKPVPSGSRLPKFLTPDEIRAVLEKAREADPEIHRLAVFSLWTGCRLSECLAADWRDFDGESLRIVGKGNRERTVPILPAAREAMGERRDLGRIFRRFHPNTVSHRFSRIALSVGCSKTFHGLRHSAATYMLKSGIPLAVVQKVLGHADIRTTQIYAKVCDDLVRAELAKLKFAAD